MDNNQQPTQSPADVPTPPLASEQPQPAPIAPPAPQPAPTPTPSPATTPEPQPSKKLSNYLKIIIPVVALFATIIIVVILNLGSNQSNPPANPDTPSTPEQTKEIPEKISLKWSSGDAPGNDYEVNINSTTGEYHLKNQPSCDTLECSEGTYYPEATEYSGTYSSETLTKILDFYTILDFSSKDADLYEKNFWFMTLVTLAEPEKPLDDSSKTNHETAYEVLDELKEAKLKSEELKAQLIEETGSEYLNCMPIVPEDRVERCDYAYSINYPYITY